MKLIMDSVIGHRGLAAGAPENTLASIRKAADAGLQWIEMDVTLLGDGSAVMFHDPRVNRTTSGRGHLKRFSLEQAKALDAGSWFGPEFKDERIPTLAEALSVIKECGLSLNLELKPNRCDLTLLVDKVTETLQLTDFPDERLLVSSFNHKALVLYRARNKSRISCLFESLPRNWKHKTKQVEAVAVHLNARKLNEKKAQEIKASGYELYCYTVNDKVTAERLNRYGVDGFFSDDPDVLK